VSLPPYPYQQELDLFRSTYRNKAKAQEMVCAYIGYTKKLHEAARAMERELEDLRNENIDLKAQNAFLMRTIDEEANKCP
jgi:predicted nucleotidyltransferase